VNDGQTQYQVRFDWGLAGARAIGQGVDAIILVDVLPSAALDLEAAAPAVIRGNLRNRGAVAQWALAAQGDKGDRFMIAVVASGEPRDDGSIRFAVEDLLGAGAIIDALGDVGIDYCSPEAAAASAAYLGLKNATGHLIGASASGRALTADGRRADVDHAIARDAADPIGE
jgi:2-phosphosulfolactate phosphatase